MAFIKDVDIFPARTHNGLIDVALGMAGNETALVSVTYNFTDHINYIGFTTYNNEKKGLYFRILNKAWRGKQAIMKSRNSYLALPFAEIPELIDFGHSDWNRHKYEWFLNDHYMEGQG